VEFAREVAAKIPRAKLVELDGVDHWPAVGDIKSITDEVEEFLTGHRHEHPPDRVLATVIADGSGHHDTLCGMTDAGRAKMLLAAVKHGLDIRDVAPSVSLFKGVRVGDDGTLGFTGSAGPGAAVDLLIHLPVVVALVNTAHPLDPDPALTGLDVLAWRAGDQLTTPVNDEPEYLRALFNTESTWAAAQTSEVFK